MYQTVIYAAVILSWHATTNQHWLLSDHIVLSCYKTTLLAVSCQVICFLEFFWLSIVNLSVYHSSMVIIIPSRKMDRWIWILKSQFLIWVPVLIYSLHWVHTLNAVQWFQTIVSLWQWRKIFIYGFMIFNKEAWLGCYSLLQIHTCIEFVIIMSSSNLVWSWNLCLSSTDYFTAHHHG